MKLSKIEPKFIKKNNPRIGLITLASDFRIEKDFNDIIYGKDIDLYSNRINCYNPLTNETLKKMADDIPEVTKNILPDQKLDCVAPITSAINALKTLKIDKVSIFTPYTDEINQSVINYFKNEKIEISELSYFDIASDLDIGKVDPQHLFDVLVKQDLSNSDALFVSCTALPVLSIINDIEKKLGKVILSSNQTLIWDTLKQIDNQNKVDGYGALFNN